MPDIRWMHPMNIEMRMADEGDRFIDCDDNCGEHLPEHYDYVADEGALILEVPEELRIIMECPNDVLVILEQAAQLVRDYIEKNGLNHDE